MKKQISRLVCAILLMTMAVTLIGCASAPSGTSAATSAPAAASTPAVTASAAATTAQAVAEREPKTLTVLAWDLGDATALPIGDNFWTDYIQENFGTPNNITMQWQSMPRWEETTMLNVWMASQEAADIIYTYDINLVVGYINQNGLSDLTEPLDTYGQELKEFLGEQTLSYGVFNGRQYVIPGRRVLPGIVGSVIRGDWLEKLNLPVPTTTEEWYNTMIAFRDEDPGELGELNIPCGMGMQEISFGYFNMLYSFIDPDISDKDLATIYPFNYPGYKDGVKFINKCYNEGLISPEFALDTDCSKMWSDVTNGYVGFYTQNVLSGMPRGAGTARHETMAQNVPGAYYLACDTFTNANGAHPKLSNQPYDKFIMVPVFSKSANEAVMYMNWMCDRETMPLLQFGQEGKDKAWYYGDNGLIVRNTSYDGLDRGASLAFIVNGWDYGSEDMNIKGQTADYKTEQAAIAYKMSLTDRRLDPWFFPYWKTPITSESKYSNAIIDKYKEMFTRLYMCDPAQFDALYDQLVGEFMLMYGNEVCAERLEVWEKTME